MKKLLAFLALAPGCVLAQQPLTFSATMTATGATASAHLTNNVSGANIPVLNHTVQAVVTGSASACSLRLEGSLDNATWDDLSGAQDCTSGLKTFHVDGKLLSYVRVYLSAWTGGTSLAVKYLGTN